MHYLQAKSAAIHKIIASLSSKLLHFTNFFQALSYIFPSLNFTPYVCWIFLVFLSQKLMDRYGYNHIATGILTFIYHAKHDVFLPGFDCFILLLLIWCISSTYMFLQVRTGTLHLLGGLLASLICDLKNFLMPLEYLNQYFPYLFTL